MIKLVIVDDNQQFMKDIYDVIKEFYNSRKIRVSLQCYDKSELLMYDLVEQMKYDIYFLDIEMPKISGIILAKEIRNIDKNSFIVFITSYLKYSIVGYELDVYRYIPKTAIHTKLIEALKAMTDEILKINDHVYIISTSTKYEKIPYKDILYIYKDSKNSVLVAVL